MARRQQLIGKLPKLPGKVDRRLMTSTIRGLKDGGHARFGDSAQLVDPKTEHHWFLGRHIVQIPDTVVDLLKTHVVRRKLLSFHPQNQVYRRMVNRDLAGGESYSILITLLGLCAGFVSGAKLIWTGITETVSLARDPQPVRARDGDEVHQLEIVRVRGGKFEHEEWIILVDPFRVKANRDIKQWIIHDERREVQIE